MTSVTHALAQDVETRIFWVMKTSVAVPVTSWQATEQVPSLQLLLRPLQSEVDWRRMVWFWVRITTMRRTTCLPLKQVRMTCLRAFGGRAGLWLVKGRIPPGVGNSKRALRCVTPKMSRAAWGRKIRRRVCPSPSA